MKVLHNPIRLAVAYQGGLKRSQILTNDLGLLALLNQGMILVGWASRPPYKGRARCPSHKTSKIIPQICNTGLLYKQQIPRSHVEVLESRIEVLQSRVEVLQSRVEVLQSRVEVLQSRVEVLQSRVEVLRSRVEVLQSRVEVLQTLSNTGA
ncbi:hypothetical protein [Nostoc sp.]|uniref:hypothetical protein n=1 Tax=Nostoc sp. TaxID=1180 RepID=UPI002FF55070